MTIQAAYYLLWHLTVNIEAPPTEELITFGEDRTNSGHAHESSALESSV
jgi:hypothetical protein